MNNLWPGATPEVPEMKTTCPAWHFDARSRQRVVSKCQPNGHPGSAGSENGMPGMALRRMVTEAGCQQILAGRAPESAGGENDMPGMALCRMTA